MKKVLARMKINRRQCITYAFVIAAYIVLQILSGQKLLSSTARGMLVPICAYVVMAISLNLTVGVMGELSLGHAGFMSVGAFMGTTAAVSLQGVIASAPLRLAIAMVIGAVFAAIFAVFGAKHFCDMKFLPLCLHGVLNMLWIVPAYLLVNFILCPEALRAAVGKYKSVIDGAKK